MGAPRGTEVQAAGRFRRPAIRTLFVLALGAVALSLAAVPVAAEHNDCKRTTDRDVFVGSDKGDECETDGGNDSLFGRGGNDDLEGEDGKDEVRGGPDHDDVSGGGGSDCDSPDTERKEGVFGDDGEDFVEDFSGGGDKDCVYGGRQGDLVKAADGDPRDRIDGGHGYDLCEGDSGDSFIDCEEITTAD